MAAQAFSTLTPVQAQVVLALAQGSTVTAAAAAAGINRCTIPEWRRTHKEFDLAVQEARDEYRLTLRDSLCELSRVALSTLRALIENSQTPAAVRGRLALAVLLQLKLPPFDPPTRDRAGLTCAPIPHNPTESNTSGASSSQPAAFTQHNPSQSNTSSAPPEPPTPLQPVHQPKTGRNDPCPCGSGKKFKRCCLPMLTPQAPTSLELE